MTLQLLDQRTAPVPLHALIEPAFGWDRPLGQAITIQLHCPDLKPNRRLAALHNDKVLIGKLVDGKTYYRRMKWIRIAIAIVVAIIAVMIGLLIFQEYQA